MRLPPSVLACLLPSLKVCLGNGIVEVSGCCFLVKLDVLYLLGGHILISLSLVLFLFLELSYVKCLSDLVCVCSQRFTHLFLILFEPCFNPREQAEQVVISLLNWWGSCDSAGVLPGAPGLWGGPGPRLHLAHVATSVSQHWQVLDYGRNKVPP